MWTTFKKLYRGILMKTYNKLKILAVVLAVALTVTLFPVNHIVYAVQNEEFATQEQLDELERLKEREKELAAQQAELDSQMNAIKSEVSQLQSQSSNLNSQLEDMFAEDLILQEDYDRLNAELATATETMNAAIQDYENAKANVDLKQEEYEKRMVAMYMRGQKSDLEILLESDGITGFFTNLRLLEVIGYADQEALAELTLAREEAEVMKLRAEEYKIMYDEFVEEKSAEISLLAQGIASTKTDLSAIQNDILNRGSQLSGLESESSAIGSEQSNVSGSIGDVQSEINTQAEATIAARAEATRAAEAERARKAEENRRATAAAEAAREEAARQEAANQGGNSVSSSGFAHPAPGNYRVTSHYGWRTSPIWGGAELHGGMDLGGNFGDPLIASKAGVVERVNYPFPNSNYGGYSSGIANYVVINHGDGSKTEYWHMKAITVSVGQTVSQGQKIGTIGSTGYSTGPHLHFVIRINGARVNPYSYIFG